jgi:hypothetical protein
MDDWEDIEFTEEDRERMKARVLGVMEHGEKHGIHKSLRDFDKLVRKGCDEEWLATKWRELEAALDRLEALANKAYKLSPGLDEGSWIAIEIVSPWSPRGTYWFGWDLLSHDLRFSNYFDTLEDGFDAAIDALTKSIDSVEKEKQTSGNTTKEGS